MIDKREILIRKLIKLILATMLLCILAVFILQKYNRKTLATSEMTEFNFTGHEETWRVPYSGFYKIYCYGASGYIGANENLTATNPNKKIEYIRAKAGSLRASVAYLQKDTQLTIHVGGQSANGTTAGWNDAGEGRSYSDSNWVLKGYAGGGSSYIKIGNNKIISASGGQGSGNEGCDKATGNKEILMQGGSGGGENSLNNAEGCQWNIDKLNISLIDQRAGSGYISIELNEFHPDVELVSSNTEFTNQNVVLTANVYDRNELPRYAYAWNDENERVDSNTYVAQHNGTYKVKVINSYGYTSEASIEVNNIDKIKPNVNNIEQTLIDNYGKSIVKLTGNDTGNEEFVASGIAGYAVTETEEIPTEFITAGTNGREANEFEINKNGTFYAWVIDKAGNISDPRQFVVKDVNITISGHIIWNDKDNMYNTRNTVTITVYKKNNDGTNSVIATKPVSSGNDTYEIITRPTDDNGNPINFEIVQSEVDSYRTVSADISYDENTIVKDFENTLYCLDFNSNITYEEFSNNYDDGEIKIKIKAEISASNDSSFNEAVYNAITTITIDQKIDFDPGSIKFIYDDGNAYSDTVNDYTVTNNSIVFGNNSLNTIYGKKSKLTFEAFGMIREQGEYVNTIKFNGKLVNYQGENTNINLGTITEKNDEITVKKITNEYYLQTEELDEYELSSTEYYLAINGEHISAKEKEFEGYAENTEHESRIVEMDVSDDVELVLKRYYDIEDFYLKSEEYKVQQEGVNGTIIKISPKTNYKTLKSKIETNGSNLRIQNLNGENVGEEDWVGTGYKLLVDYINKVYEYEIAINGDLNGDGFATLTDLAMLKQYLVQKITLTGIREKAADLNFDSKVSLTDFSILKQYIVKKIEL